MLVASALPRDPPVPEAIVTRTLPARRNATRHTCLMLCLAACLTALAGCDRDQKPGPGPKPISGGTSSTPAPSTLGASAAQGAAR